MNPLSATESELMTKIASAKKDQELLNVKLQKIMEEPLAEKALFISQMMEYQSKISASSALMKKLEADLKAAQIQKELAKQKMLCSVQNTVHNPNKFNNNVNQVQNAASFSTSRFNPANAIYKNKEKTDDQKGLMAAMHCLKKGQKIVFNSSQTAKSITINQNISVGIQNESQSQNSIQIDPHSVFKNKEKLVDAGNLTSAIGSTTGGDELSSTLVSQPTHVVLKNKETPPITDGLTSAIDSIKKGGKIIFNSNQSMPSHPAHLINKNNDAATESYDGITSAIDSLKKGHKITFNSNQSLSRFHPSMAMHKNKKPQEDSNEEAGESLTAAPGSEAGLQKAMDLLKCGKKIILNANCPSRFDPSQAIRKNSNTKSNQGVQPLSIDKTASGTNKSHEHVEISCSGLNKSNNSTVSQNNSTLSNELKMPFLCTTSVSGDGSCLMYASLENLKYPEVQAGANMIGMDCHVNVRKTVCKFLRTNKELQGLEAFQYMKNNALEELASRRNVPEGSVTWSHYLEEMENDTACMADATFLQGMALYLGKDLLITSPTNTPSQPWTLVEATIEGTSFKSHGLPLTFFRRNKHYDPIARLKTETIGCRGCGEITEDISSHLELNQRRRCYVFYRDDSPTAVHNNAGHSKEIDASSNGESSSVYSELEPPMQSPNVPQQYDTSVGDNEVHDVSYVHTDDFEQEQGNISSQQIDMKVYKNECGKCHLQFASVDSLGKHKRSTSGECLSRVCQDSHNHKYIVKKFDRELDVQEFIGEIEGSWKEGANDSFEMTRRNLAGSQLKLL